ncbi:MAG: OstA-like protein [Chitinophagaceae bacterium]
MKTSQLLLFYSRAFVVLLLLQWNAFVLYAQSAKQENKRLPINILDNGQGESITKDGVTLFKFSDHVIFQHGTDIMYCDTAYLNQQQNSMEAFGNIKIVQQNGTTAESDYLSYTGNTKKAYMHGNVALKNADDNLWTEELDYNLTTKIGNYYQGGTLQSGSTTVSSTLGTYNAQTKEARFTEDVLVTDTSYNIESRDLGYNTDSKMMRFFDTSVVYNERSILHTSSGTYDSKLEIANFYTRSSIQNEEQYIEGDSLHYNKQTGIGEAYGKVIIHDTTEKATLFCGRAFGNDKLKTLLAVDKPVMRKKSESDSMFVRADTFYSAHLVFLEERVPFPPSDSASAATGPGKKRKEKMVPREQFQTIRIPDTTSPKYYSGFHHVKIFSDSLQGRCDSICFTGKDSLILMMHSPIVWSRKSQVTGDTIKAFIDSGKISKIVVPNDALVVSRSGPEKADIFNQIQGRTLTAYLVNNELDFAMVRPDAECIYYVTDDAGAYIGVSQSKSERMKVYFSKGEIDRIFQIQEVDGKLSPLPKVDLRTMRLSRFQWLDKLRPKELFELFE